MIVSGEDGDAVVMAHCFWRMWPASLLAVVVPSWLTLVDVDGCCPLLLVVDRCVPLIAVVALCGSVLNVVECC